MPFVCYLGLVVLLFVTTQQYYDTLFKRKQQVVYIINRYHRFNVEELSMK